MVAADRALGAAVVGSGAAASFEEGAGHVRGIGVRPAYRSAAELAGWAAIIEDAVCMHAALGGVHLCGVGCGQCSRWRDCAKAEAWMPLEYCMISSEESMSL